MEDFYVDVIFQCCANRLPSSETLPGTRDLKYHLYSGLKTVSCNKSTCPCKSGQPVEAALRAIFCIINTCQQDKQVVGGPK